MQLGTSDPPAVRVPVLFGKGLQYQYSLGAEVPSFAVVVSKAGKVTVLGIVALTGTMGPLTLRGTTVLSVLSTEFCFISTQPLPPSFLSSTPSPLLSLHTKSLPQSPQSLFSLDLKHMGSASATAHGERHTSPTGHPFDPSMASLL